jgi:hypothetical protein
MLVSLNTNEEIVNSRIQLIDSSSAILNVNSHNPLELLSCVLVYVRVIIFCPALVSSTFWETTRSISDAAAVGVDSQSSALVKSLGRTVGRRFGTRQTDILLINISPLPTSPHLAADSYFGSSARFQEVRQFHIFLSHSPAIIPVDQLFVSDAFDHVAHH